QTANSNPSIEFGAEEADLIKLDIINEVVNRTGITKTKAEMAVETVFESMKRPLGRAERIELRGFGIFNVRPRKTGIGRNPRTGAEVAIPPGKAVRFKPGKELQQLQSLTVNPAAAQEPSRLRELYWLHTLLLALTVITTSAVGARLEYNFH